MTQNVQELLCQELFVQNALQVRNSAVKSREEQRAAKHGEAMRSHVATVVPQLCQIFEDFEVEVSHVSPMAMPWQCYVMLRDVA